jgi:hypothetical protein
MSRASDGVCPQPVRISHLADVSRTARAAGGATYASLLSELSVEDQHAVRQRFLERCEAFRRSDGLHLPTGLLLVSAVR